MGFGQGEDLSLMQSGDPSQLKGSADITGAAQRAGLTGAKGKDERMYGAGDKYGGGQARFNVEEKQMREQIDTLFQKAQGGDRAARQELSKIHADLTSQADRAEGGPRIRPGQRQLETTVGGSGAQKLPQVIVNRILKDYGQQFRNVRAERTQGRRAAR
jgi:predicted RNA-binding Zn ribbon-like protein